MTRTLSILIGVAVIAAVVAAILLNRESAHDVTPMKQLRIVSLSPAMTEALYEMQLGDSLVGVSESCNYPPEATKLPQVGSLGMTNIESMLALRPTLVVSTDFERDDTMQAIRASGAQVIEGHIATIDQMFESFQKIGEVTGHQQQAALLVDRMKQDLATIRARYSSTPPERRPRVYLEVWHEPVTTVGSQSFLDDVLAQSGGVNVAHEIAQPYPLISAEKVIQWNPDVIILSAHMEKGQGLSILKQRIGWDQIKAIREQRVIDDLDMDLLIRPGPRLTQGMRLLNERLYSAQEAK